MFGWARPDNRLWFHQHKHIAKKMSENMKSQKKLNADAILSNGFATLALVVYAVIVVVYLGYYQQNTSTSKTYYYSSASYGVSDYKPFENRRLLFTASAANVALLPAAAFVGKNKISNIVAVGISGLLGIFDLVMFLVSLFQDFAYCNTPGTPSNICRDRAFCCVPSYYSNAVHQCPTAVALPSGSICAGDNANLKPEALGVDTGYIMYLLFLASSAIMGGVIVLCAYTSIAPIEMLSQALIEFVGGHKDRSKAVDRERKKNAQETEKRKSSGDFSSSSIKRF